MITMPGFLFFVVCFTFYYYYYPFYALEKEGEEKENEISCKCCDLHFLCQGCFYVLFYTSVLLFSEIIFLKVAFWPSSSEETNMRRVIGIEH